MTPAFVEFKLFGDVKNDVLDNSTEQNEARCLVHIMRI